MVQDGSRGLRQFKGVGRLQVRLFLRKRLGETWLDQIYFKILGGGADFYRFAEFLYKTHNMKPRSTVYPDSDTDSEPNGPTGLN